MKSKQSKTESATKRRLHGLVHRIGWAVQITRQDGTKFFAASARGVVTPVWNMGNKHYADQYVRELRNAKFNAKRVRVLFADPIALNEATSESAGRKGASNE